MTPDGRPAPFVGPRPYKIGEKLFGRDREKLELLDLLIAERIVLLYSPSGAGKTSLVQAALVPALRDERFTVPAVARVIFERTTAVLEPAANRYVFAVLLSLEEERPKDEQLPLADLAHMTLPDYLDQRWAAAEQTGGLALILDQFEEILTSNPTDTRAKKEFFTQLGVALHSRHRWVLVSMREEHVAGLDPYRSLIPTRLTSTFRLDLLNDDQARQAMQQASARAGVVFTDGAARKLTDDLRRVQVLQPDGSLETQFGPTVEPTQLQVVCLRLWSRLAADRESIEERDVEALGSADTALSDYYSDTVSDLDAQERRVRDWIEDVLITPQGLRNQVLKDDALRSHRVDAEAISLLSERHLVREERRRGISWLELTHDRLVQPIRSNNTVWREEHLTSFQRQAVLWDKENRPSRLELRGSALVEAERWAEAHEDELTSIEQGFLQACVHSRQREKQRKRTNWTFVTVFIAGMLATVVAWAHSEWRQAQPWAYLTNLASGDLNDMRGDVVSIGRSVGLIKNKIDLRPTTVSRLHLFVARDRSAQDARSLNGTTINARFLRYGTERQLMDGDLVAIAGMALFRFSVAQPPVVPFIPASPPKSSRPTDGAWARLIDGESRTVIPLTENGYFLAKGADGRISLENTKRDGSLLRITRTNERNRGFEIDALETTDEDYLFAILKFEDRFYVAMGVPSGMRVSQFLRDQLRRPVPGTDYGGKMTFCVSHSSQGRFDSRYGVLTRTIQIVTDNQPNCTLGPFQIVVF